MRIYAAIIVEYSSFPEGIFRKIQQNQLSNKDLQHFSNTSFPFFLYIRKSRIVKYFIAFFETLHSPYIGFVNKEIKNNKLLKDKRGKVSILTLVVGPATFRFMGNTGNGRRSKKHGKDFI